MKKISFIVACYNLKEYIIRCLETLVSQNIPTSEYDIIVVNDGSSDDSLALITEFAHLHDNIRIIDQQNQGLSEARNSGFRTVNSKYVWFIDGDDWISHNCLHDLLHVCEQNNLDMFGVAPSIPYQDDFQSVYNAAISVSPVLPGKERLLTGLYIVGAWAYIFKTDFLHNNNLWFKKGIYFEDVEFISRVLYCAQRVALLEGFSVYNYFVRENSICNSFSSLHISSTLAVARSLVDFSETTASQRVMQQRFKELAADMVLFGLKMMKTQREEFIQVKKFLVQTRKDNLYPFLLCGTTAKKKIFIFYCGMCAHA